VRREVGRGDDTVFWKDVWVGSQSLHVKYPRLFVNFMQQDMSITEVGC